MVQIANSSGLTLRPRAVASSQLRFSASRASTTFRHSSVIVRASNFSTKPPPGVSVPPVQPSAPPSIFGFVEFAEKMNSRAAMIGFFALLAVEAVTGQSLLALLGFNIGSGLGFEL